MMLKGHPNRSVIARDTSGAVLPQSRATIPHLRPHADLRNASLHNAILTLAAATAAESAPDVRHSGLWRKMRNTARPDADGQTMNGRSA